MDGYRRQSAQARTEDHPDGRRGGDGVHRSHRGPAAARDHPRGPRPRRTARSRTSAAAGACSRSIASASRWSRLPATREKRARFAAVVDGPPSLVASGLSIGFGRRDVAVDAIARRSRVCATVAARHWKHRGLSRRIRSRRARGAARCRRSPRLLDGSSSPDQADGVKGSAEQRAYRVQRRPHRHRAASGSARPAPAAGPDEPRGLLRRTDRTPMHSVSRRHAHIEFSAEDRCYRLWDDSSAHGHEHHPGRADDQSAGWHARHAARDRATKSRSATRACG